MNGKLKQLLMTVNNRVRADYETYLHLIPSQQQTAMSWLHRDFLPTIILLPSLTAEKDCEDGVKLASMLELSYMAQQVHNQAPADGEKGDYQMPILIGDYLFATAFKRLVENRHTKWLERLGNAICRMNEGKTVRSQWKERNFVPIDEKIENLHKEFGELAALAGMMGAESAGLNQEENQVFTAFSYYAGVLQGIMLNSYQEETPAVVEKYVSYCEQYLFSLPAELGRALRKWLLENLLGADYAQGGYEKDSLLSQSNLA